MAKNKTQIETSAFLFISGSPEEVSILLTIEDGEKTILEDKKFGSKYNVIIKKEKNKYILTPEYSNSPKYYEIRNNDAIKKIADETSLISKIKSFFN